MKALKLKGFSPVDAPAKVQVEVSVGADTVAWVMAVSGWSKLRAKRAAAYQLMLNHEADFCSVNVAFKWVGGDSPYTSLEVVHVDDWDLAEAEADPSFHFDPEVKWAGLAYLGW